MRNRFVAHLVSALFVAHATPGGKIEALCREMIAAGKTLFTFDCLENAGLIDVGARAVGSKDLVQAWSALTRDRGRSQAESRESP